MEKKFYVKIRTKSMKYDTCFGIIYDDVIGKCSEFKTRDEAVTYAKKEVARLREDVPIYTIDSVAKFPLDDIKVETVV